MVNHSILLSKLSNYGLRGTSLKIIISYLTNRMQCVPIKEAQSSMLPVKCEVPQGSILGPLLYLIYIDDIQSSSNILKFVLFADDTIVFLSSPNFLSLVQSINNEPALLSDWFKANKLSPNVAKTKYLLFGSKKLVREDTNFNIILDGTAISSSTTTKFLGVKIDSQLNWKQHINKLVLKLNRNAAVIFKKPYKINTAVAL